MARTALLALLLPWLVALGGCAARRRSAPRGAVVAPAAAAPGRTAAAIKAGFEASKKREPYFPLLTQAQAKAAMPPFAGPRDLPTLMLVAGLQPRSMESVMASARAIRREGGLDAELMNDVFWAVSSANDCFYWMGHVDFMAAVAGQPSTHVFDLENASKLDERRRVALPFAQKLTKAPATVERADIDGLREHFNDKEIVQLVFAVCHFNTMNRLADAFGVPLEPTNVFAKPAAKPSMPPVPTPSTTPPAPDDTPPAGAGSSTP